MEVNHNIQEDNKSKKEMFNSLDMLKSGIISCRNNLNQAGKDKELWFKKKKGLAKLLKEKIILIKEKRKKRNELTSKVRELKEKRAKLNEDVRKKISEIVAVKSQANILAKKSKIKSPLTIKRDIEFLESKLETEAMPFEKEKELSKRIKQLKKSLEESSSIISIFDKAKNLGLEISLIKKESSTLHAEIKKLAGQSQAIHEEIIEDSKIINALKLEEEEAFKKFSELKKIFNQLNYSLKEKLRQMNEISLKVNKFRLEDDEKRKLNETVAIKTKELELEQKIKSGKKLTTDDFLLFQETLKGKRLKI